METAVGQCAIAMVARPQCIEIKIANLRHELNIVHALCSNIHVLINTPVPTACMHKFNKIITAKVAFDTVSAFAVKSGDVAAVKGKCW